MKNCLLFFSLFILLSCVSLNGQNPFNPNGIAGKKLFIDHQTIQSDRFVEFGNLTHGFELAYLRNLSRFVNIGIPLKVGVINLPDELNNRTIIGVDGIVQFQWWKKKNFVVPYVFTGVGAVNEDFEKTNFEIPAGLGINARLWSNIYLNVQTEFRYSMAEDRSNFQHGIGLMYLIGKTDQADPEDIENLLTAQQDLQPDADSDGIPDDADVCPDIAGLAVFLGCPDTDSDGIADKDDDCPEEPGSPVTGGCPDSDGDGIADTEDECPEEVGTIAFKGCPATESGELAKGYSESYGALESSSLPEGGPDNDGDGIANADDECPDAAGSVNGCPDTDADGVPDKDDACPQLAGEVALRGCSDTDGDGINDSDDRCPGAAGTVSNGGCPEISTTESTNITYETREKLEAATQAVQFNFASATLKRESYPVLDEVANLVFEHPGHYLSITGHTDNVGTERNNLKLSHKRAKACYDYLLTKGIAKERLSYGGYGETRPLSENNSDAGRALNRRTEFNLYTK